MKASDLIQELQRGIELHGDLPVFAGDYVTHDETSVVQCAVATQVIHGGVKLDLPERFVLLPGS